MAKDAMLTAIRTHLRLLPTHPIDRYRQLASIEYRIDDGLIFFIFFSPLTSTINPMTHSVECPNPA